MGLGAEEARVKVRLLEPVASEPAVKHGAESDATGICQDVLETLLAKIGVAASVVPESGVFVTGEEGTGAPLTFDIQGDDLGLLIGRRGQTLASLQYIARLIVAHQMMTMVPIIVDVNGYKKRRYQALRALALRMAEQVKARRMPFTLEPMPAFERRIIHVTLADHPDVTTQSVGVGEARKVVILLKENISSTGWL